MDGGPLAGAIYVYGVSSQQGYTPVATRGVQDEEVRAVESNGLVALTSGLSEAALGARDVRAHWRVIEQAFEHGPVLPFRLGTVLESEQAVRAQVLDSNAEQLADQLGQMAGLVQLSLKGRYDEERLLADIVRSNPDIAEMRQRVFSGSAGTGSPSAQIALGQLVERAVGDRRAQDGALARKALDPHSVAAQEEEVAHPNAFNLAFLVERRAVDRFSDAVGGLRDQLGDRIEIRYVGPMPPYSFTDGALSTVGGSWA